MTLSRIPSNGERVRVTSGDYAGRLGYVSSYDDDRGILFVDLDHRPDPAFEPGFTLGCGLSEVERA